MAALSARDLDAARRRLIGLGGSPDLTMVVADELGMIEHVDDGLAHALGWDVGELIGRPLTEIIPRRFRDAHHIGFARFLVTGQPRLLDRPTPLWVCARDGSERRVEHLITGWRTDRGWRFAAAVDAEGSDGG
jgi:PAS domain S-box-containing protein